MSISHRGHLFEVAFVWELTKESMHLPPGCLQGGSSSKCGVFLPSEAGPPHHHDDQVDSDQ